MTIQIIAPSGEVFNTPTSYTTSLEDIFLRGRILGVTSMKVFYGGETFEGSDIYLDGLGGFIFPNPLIYTEGIGLSKGLNEFRIDATAGVASFGVVSVILVGEVLNLVSPPSGVGVRRTTNAVEVYFPHVEGVSYYNLYASRFSGGGASGYTRVNFEPIDPIKHGVRREVISEYGSVFSDISVIEGSVLSLEVQGVQKDTGVDGQVDVVGEVGVPSGATRLRVESKVSGLSLETEVSFKHNRLARETSIPKTNSIGDFIVLSSSEPLYYVVTSVSFVNGVEVESAYSAEASGKPIAVSPSSVSLPVVTRDNLAQDMVYNILRAQPDVQVQAGSVIRDVFIDPVVSEFERSRFLLDFAYRASSFFGLLQIDDPRNTGVSVSVANSAYKTALKAALFLESDTATQDLIDGAFEKLASNFGVTRKTGSYAAGEVEFSTSNTPTFTISIARGTILTGASVRFYTTKDVTIPLADISKYYNPTTKKYSVRAPILAQEVGLSGNLTSGQINTGAPFGLSVTNPAPTFGGNGAETNLQLATRALGVLSSVDVGTKAGYERVSRAIPGVIDSFVVGAGDALMKRDLGLGGKVDIWVKGESLSTYTDVFAPKFNTRFGSRFIPVGEIGSYRFRALDATLENPLFEMIDRTDLSVQYGLKKTTSGDEFFDLTGYVIEDYRTIRLDADIEQPTYTVADIILGDWREEFSEQLVLSQQPVKEIISVVDESNAQIPYSFVNEANPLLEGFSSREGGYLVLENISGDKIKQVLEEKHTIIGFYVEMLNKRGVNTLTISVSSLTGVVYAGPFQTGTPDYIIIDDGLGEIGIKRTEGSSILDGEVLLISYEYVENIVVRYRSNAILKTAQESLDAQKNIGADVLVKEIRPCSVSVSAVVILERGQDVVQVDTDLRFALSRFITSQSIGGEIRPSEIIREINNTAGVSHVRLPLTRMSLKEDSFILREEINVDVGNYRRITSLSNANAYVWVIDTRLLNMPKDLGGMRARVVIKNDRTQEETEMSLLDGVERLSASYWKKNTACIIGSLGVGLIPNSAAKVVLGLPIGADPSEYVVYVDYVVEDKIEVVSEIKLNAVSYFEVGDLSFTYEGL
jgi:uncharacterized phage protein gp47/JayE